MLETIEEVRDRLVKEWDPEGIILFGSRAAGNASEDSDFDILIVKETSERPIDRRIAAESILADRAVALDIFVYNPAEMLFLHSIGSPFIEEIVETGRVIYMRKATGQWLKDAEEEYSTAQILLDHGLSRGSCFHSQQCVEKCLKALILEQGDKPEKTHDIVGLHRHVKRLGIDVTLHMDDAVFLNSIYKGRYPSEEGLLPHGEPSKDDAVHSVDAAGKTLESCRKLLK